jgi:hypothetical protein
MYNKEEVQRRTMRAVRSGASCRRMRFSRTRVAAQGLGTEDDGRDDPSFHLDKGSSLHMAITNPRFGYCVL